MSDTSGFPSFDQIGAPPGSDSAFPTSTTQQTSADDTLYGVTKALGVVPVAVKRQPQPTAQDIMELPPGAPGLGQASPEFDIQPMESAIAQFDHLDAANRAKLQENLLAAGYYPASYYGTNPPILVPGENDPASRAAWKNAVEDAARASTYEKGQLTNPKTVQDVITERIANRQSQGVTPGGAASKARTLSNPDDLRAAIRNAGPSVIGRRPDAAVEENFIAAYHNAEAQAGARDANGNVTAGPSSPSALAEQYLQTVYPQEAYDNGFLGAFDTFRKMIGGSTSG